MNGALLHQQTKLEKLLIFTYVHKLGLKFGWTHHSLTQ